MHPHVTVIVLNWNGKTHLETVLPALLRQTYPSFTPVVVDNGSTDESVAFVREHFTHVRLVELRANQGFSSANNVVLRELASPYYALLNNDTQPTPGWLGALVAALEARPTYGAAASRMMRFGDRALIDNCGDELSVAGTTAELGRGEPMSTAFAHSRDVFSACGGACLYRSEMLRDAGLLDELFFMTYEDVDLGFRAQRRGWRTIYVPDALVYHKVRATMRLLPQQQVYYSQRNIEWLWLKNMPTSLLLRYAHLRIVYWLGSLLFFARAGALRAFLRAKYDAYRRLPAVLRTRKAEQALGRITAAELKDLLTRQVIRRKVAKWFGR